MTIQLGMSSLEMSSREWAGSVVMPERVHLLVSEPERGLLADAIRYLRLMLGEEVKHFNHGGHRGSQGKSAGSLRVSAQQTGANPSTSSGQGRGRQLMGETSAGAKAPDSTRVTRPLRQAQGRL